MNHTEHWTEVREHAGEKLRGLFVADGLAERVLPRGVGSKDDVRRALAFALRDGTPEEAACAIVAASSWVQAHNELATVVSSAGERAPAK